MLSVFGERKSARALACLCACGCVCVNKWCFGIPFAISHLKPFPVNSIHFGLTAVPCFTFFLGLLRAHFASGQTCLFFAHTRTLTFKHHCTKHCTPKTCISIAAAPKSGHNHSTIDERQTRLRRFFVCQKDAARPTRTRTASKRTKSTTTTTQLWYATNCSECKYMLTDTRTLGKK